MDLSMKIFAAVLIILAIVFVITTCVGAYVFSDKTNHRYCKMYDHEQLKLWEHMHTNVFNFKYVYTYRGNRHFVWDNYEAVIWVEDGLTSVHERTDAKECILCTFDKKYSEKMGALLLNCVGVPEDEKLSFRNRKRKLRT